MTGEEDPAGREKDSLESRMIAALTQYWQEQYIRVWETLGPKVPASRKATSLESALNDKFWTAEERELLAILLPMLQEGAAGGVDAHAAQLAEMGLGVDWTLPHTDAADWARKYGGKLVRGVTRTTRDRVGVLTSNWLETPGANIGDLSRTLQGEFQNFGRYRSKLIAITETTAAYARGEMTAARAVEKEGLFEYDKTWLSARDERVCPICQPMDGIAVRGSNAIFDLPNGQKVKGPPGHVGCRCWLAMRPVLAREEEAIS